MSAHSLTRGVGTLALPFALSIALSVPALAGSYNPPSKQPPFPPSTAQAPWMSVQSVQLINNGGFEAGLAGWTSIDEVGSSGSWFAFGGALGPVSFLPLAPPAMGALQAVTDQDAPGSHILYQDVTIPPLATATLDLLLWYNCYAPQGFAPQPTLDYTVPGPNEQFRIDIMNPLAPVNDMGAGVLLPVLLTHAADALVLPPYVHVTANLSSFAGQTVRLRFAEVDNQSNLNVGIDAVSILAEPVVPVASATWGKVKGLYR